MTTRLHLIRHGPPVMDLEAPAATWRLADETIAYQALAGAAGFPRDARWITSAEPKAVDTAHRLRECLGLPCDDVVIAPELGELGRGGVIADRSEFETAVVRSLENPHVASVSGWETVDDARERLVGFVGGPVAEPVTHVVEDLALVGHGTAWTVLVGAVTGRPYDVEGWRRMLMPDWCVLDLERGSDGVRTGRLVSGWGTFSVSP